MFRFSNLLGTVYREGNLLFTPNGDCVLSPVGNRVSVYDLVGSSSYTLPFEAAQNIRCLDLSPDGSLLLAVDEGGQGIVVNFEKRVVLHRMGFKGSVSCVKFSPCGRFFAVCRDRQVQVWKSPSLEREFSPFELHRKYTGPFDTVTCVDWSADSAYIIAGSADLTARVFSVVTRPGYIPPVLGGHRTPVVAAFFDESGERVYTVTRDAAVFSWKAMGAKMEMEDGSDSESSDADADADAEPGPAALRPAKRARTVASASTSTFARRWKLDQKHYFNQNHARALCAVLHKESNLLVVGFSNGVFGLYEVPDLTAIHTLSMSSKKINTVAMNSTGEWLAFGCSKLGQLLVWEWQSETSVLKQQGHDFDMGCAGYSADGQVVATGGDEGKVKLWSTQSSFCFMTFSEHTAPVTAVEFLKTGNALVSASLDGTIRAYDTLRYKNFRTFTAPTSQSVQFSSLCVDPSGEIVCGGCADSYDVFVWSVQTARLLDTLSGHEGPVSGMAFSPTAPVLASGSWDKTVRLWEVYSASTAPEVLDHQAEVLAVAYRPDGRELCVATADARLHMWDPSRGLLMGSIDGRRDLAGGRVSGDLRSGEAVAAGQSFRSVCYSGDGTCVLAGGNGKFVCMYSAAERVLLARFQVSENRSLQGVLDKLSSKHMTDAGPMDGLDLEEGADVDPGDRSDKMDLSLPGARKGDMSSRRVKPTVKVSCLRFSPTGRQWCAASSEGLLIYSKDESLVFDPFDLAVDVTPQAARDALVAGRCSDALIIALRLGDIGLVKEVILGVPADVIGATVHSTPEHYCGTVLGALAELLTQSPHLEFTLLWCSAVFAIHGRYLKAHSQAHAGAMRALQQTATHSLSALRASADNAHRLKYLANLTLVPEKSVEVGVEDEVEEKESS